MSFHKIKQEANIPTSKITQFIISSPEQRVWLRSRAINTIIEPEFNTFIHRDQLLYLLIPKPRALIYSTINTNDTTYS